MLSEGNRAITIHYPLPETINNTHALRSFYILFVLKSNVDC